MDIQRILLVGTIKNFAELLLTTRGPAKDGLLGMTVLGNGIN